MMVLPIMAGETLDSTMIAALNLLSLAAVVVVVLRARRRPTR